MSRTPLQEMNGLSERDRAILLDANDEARGQMRDERDDGRGAGIPQANEMKRTDRTACLNVAYPSGSKFNLSGHFVLAPLGSWLVPAILGRNNQAVVLDQRAIVTRDGCVIYSPRRNRDALLITQWLNQHPDWANEHEVGHDGGIGGAI